MPDYSGQQFGNYRLLHLIGKGGFAEVYLGEHVRLGMKAAIKILHTHLMAAEDIELFQREARTIAELRHPHIVRVLDFDVQQGLPFLVLDYAAQGSLRERHLRGTQVPLAQVEDYVEQMAEALQYAHDRRLIHRDIKPENMLIGEQNSLLLSDFGIATIAHATSSMRTENSMGTLAYMAPEQLQGKSRPASDQYALAISAYLWLSGNLPFQGSSTEVIGQQLAAAPPSLMAQVPALSPATEQVVLTALAKDPAQRFSSVREFAQALKRASQITSQPTSILSAPALPEPAPTVVVSASFPVAPDEPSTTPAADAKLILPGRSKWMQAKPPVMQTPALPQPPVSVSSPAVPIADHPPRRGRTWAPLIGFVSIVLLNIVLYSYYSRYANSADEATTGVFLINSAYCLLLSLLIGYCTGRLAAALFLCFLAEIIPTALLFQVGYSHGDLLQVASPYLLWMLLLNTGCSLIGSLPGAWFGRRKQAAARRLTGEVLVPDKVQKLAASKQLGASMQIYFHYTSNNSVLLNVLLIVVALLAIMAIVLQLFSFVIAAFIVLLCLLIGIIAFGRHRARGWRENVYLYQDGFVLPYNGRARAIRWEELAQQVAADIFLLTDGTRIILSARLHDQQQLHHTIQQHLSRVQAR